MKKIRVKPEALRCLENARELLNKSNMEGDR